MKAQVIINTTSGTPATDELLREIAETFKRENVDVVVHPAHSGADINRLAQQAHNTDAEIVVAGGGDGTLNSVASAIVGTDKVLGVLPLGTLNHFAKDIGIPLELEQAIKTIVNGRTAQVDVGQFNGRIFLNNSSLGLYPSIVRERQKQERLGYRKWPAYIWAALSVLRRYPFLDLHLRAGGNAVSTRTPFLFVGNNQYEMETLNIGGRSTLDGGTLSLYLTHRTGRLGLIRLAWRALFGGLNQEKDFMALTTEELTIETKKKRLRVALDGEITVVEPPIRYRIKKKALKVRVPAES